MKNLFCVLMMTNKKATFVIWIINTWTEMVFNIVDVTNWIMASTSNRWVIFYFILVEIITPININHLLAFVSNFDIYCHNSLTCRVLTSHFLRFNNYNCLKPLLLLPTAFFFFFLQTLSQMKVLIVTFRILCWSSKVFLFASSAVFLFY